MNAKWILAIWMTLSIAVLASCQQEEVSAKETAAAAEAVKGVYESAHGKNMDQFLDHFSKSGISKDELEVSMLMFSDKVDQVGGIKNFTFTHIPKDQLKKDAVDMMKEAYEDDWLVVLEESKIGGNYFWIMQKHDDRYYVINGDESPKEDILK